MRSPWPGARATYCDPDCAPDPSHVACCGPSEQSALLFYAPSGYVEGIPGPHVGGGIGGFRLGVDALGTAPVGVYSGFAAAPVPNYANPVGGVFVRDMGLPANAIGQANGVYVPSWLPRSP